VWNRAAVDLRRHVVAKLQAAGVDADTVGTRQARPDPRKPFDRRRRAARFVEDSAGIGDLPAGLEVERRLLERDIALLTC
jgi:hypothetical protein